MTLFRAAARTLLASYFVASGLRAVRDPEPLVPLAEPLADRLVPMAKQYAPSQVAQYIPEDAKTLVRVNGAAQIIGGLALATGKGRRLGAFLLAGSLVPSTVAKYPFWSETDPEKKAEARSHFLKNVSLLGGVLLAGRDTEGKPGLAWRAQKGGHALARDTRRASSRLAKKASDLAPGGSDLSDLAEGALASGAALVGAVAAGTRRSRKKASKQLKKARKVAAVQAEAARKAAKQARKDAPKQLRSARKIAAQQAEELKAAAARAAQQARKQADQQRKAAKKLGKHIQLGDN